MADAEGIWKLRLGDNVRQRELIEPAEKAVEETIESKTTQTVSSDKEPVSEATDEAATKEQPDYDKDPPAESGEPAASEDSSVPEAETAETKTTEPESRPSEQERADTE